MERIKFIERRLIFADDLKNLCADKNLYTMGDEKCLGKMLNKCRKPNITTEDIIEIAKDIHIYSHLPEGMDFTDLCSEIAEISHSFFERITMD
ncbi:MAG: hypothetical protein HFH18_14705 [Ruminococcus sp.]|nr:hypothetical protein [Ruminococcus sp.]